MCVCVRGTCILRHRLGVFLFLCLSSQFKTSLLRCRCNSFHYLHNKHSTTRERLLSKVVKMNVPIESIKLFQSLFSNKTYKRLDLVQGISSSYSNIKKKQNHNGRKNLVAK